MLRYVLLNLLVFVVGTSSATMQEECAAMKQKIVKFMHCMRGDATYSPDDIKRARVMGGICCAGGVLAIAGGYGLIAYVKSWWPFRKPKIIDPEPYEPTEQDMQKLGALLQDVENISNQEHKYQPIAVAVAINNAYYLVNKLRKCDGETIIYKEKKYLINKYLFNCVKRNYALLPWKLDEHKKLCPLPLTVTIAKGVILWPEKEKDEFNADFLFEYQKVTQKA